MKVPRSPFASEGERGTAITDPTSVAASVAQRQQPPWRGQGNYLSHPRNLSRPRRGGWSRAAGRGAAVDDTECTYNTRPHPPAASHRDSLLS